MSCIFVEICSEILIKFILVVCLYRILWEVLVRLHARIQKPTTSCTTEQGQQPKPQLLSKQEDKNKIFSDKGFELGAIEVGAPFQAPVLLGRSEEKPIRSVYYSGLQPRPLRPPVRKYQNYDDLLQECLKRKILFLDPEYPATMESLFYTEKYRLNKEREIRKVFGVGSSFEWVRPFDICPNPQFYSRDGASRLNVVQGGLGVCWVVAAITVLAMYPELLHRVAPPQDFIRKRYAGIYHFHFWFFGSWIDVVVDDKVPCVSRPTMPAKPNPKTRVVVPTDIKQPFSIRSRNNNEFAFTLLEKAYAKIHGSYETLDGGFVADAFVDLTGGFAEFHMLRYSNPRFTHLFDSYRMQSLMACFIAPDPTVVEKKLSNGLVAGHAYAITNVCHIMIEKKTKDGQVLNRSVESLVRLRNPWGRVEWNGAWSDNAAHWQYVSKATKKDIGLAQQEDGEFWMSFRDFSLNFDAYEIVHLTPYLNVMPNGRIPWDTATFHGEWITGVTAGGESQLDINPQYRITLTDPDILREDGKCTFCIALTQKYRKIMKKMGVTLIPIGFNVYHLPPEYENVAPAPRQFFHSSTLPEINARSILNTFINSERKPIAICDMEMRREITLRIRVPPGPYLIVPYSHGAEEGQFLLRVFSSGYAKMDENDRSLEVATNLPQEISPNTEAVTVVVRRYIDLLHRYEVEEISWKRLKIIMNHFGRTVPNFKGFNKEAVRSALAMVDQDENGKIDYREFYLLFEFLEHVRRIFIKEDQNKSGTFPASRFNPVITEFGFDLTQSAQRLLYHRYSREDGSFHFDDFLLCLIKTKVLSEIFKYNKTKTGLVKFNFDDWFKVTIFT